MKIVLLITAAMVVVLINTLFIYVSWNSVMPDLFKLPEIQFGQAFWLGMLCTSLFKPSSVKLNNPEE
jgi:hypothetical protein